MTKVVINTCHGGFGISAAAESKYRELAGITDPDFHSLYIPRDDEHLIAVVELMGRSRPTVQYAELKIVEIPDDVNWYVRGI
jgi:hypothetical protein